MSTAKPENLPLLLIDHCNCELKAAQSAAFLIRKYAIDDASDAVLLDWLKPYEDFVYRQKGQPGDLIPGSSLSKKLIPTSRQVSIVARLSASLTPRLVIPAIGQQPSATGETSSPLAPRGRSFIGSERRWVQRPVEPGGSGASRGQATLRQSGRIVAEQDRTDQAADQQQTDR